MAGHGLDLGPVHGHDRVAATIRAGLAVYLLLDLLREDVKLLDPAVVIGEITTELLVLCVLTFPQPPDLCQIRYHVISILPAEEKEKLRDTHLSPIAKNVSHRLAEPEVTRPLALDGKHR